MNGRNDGLAELLVKLATDTAALIDKARASGAFRAGAGGRTVDGEAVVRPAAGTDGAAKAPGAQADAQAGAQTGAHTGALQDIIVQQAMRVHALEAEVARLTAELAEARAALAAAKARPAAKKGAKKPAAKRPAA